MILKQLGRAIGEWFERRAEDAPPPHVEDVVESEAGPLPRVRLSPAAQAMIYTPSREPEPTPVTDEPALGSARDRIKKARERMQR